MSEVTLNLEDAANFLNMAASSLRAKAKSGIILGAKPSKQWVFLKSDLVVYLRSLYLRDTKVGDKQWLESKKSFTKDHKVPHGGIDSRIQKLRAKNAEALKLVTES